VFRCVTWTTAERETLFSGQRLQDAVQMLVWLKPQYVPHPRFACTFQGGRALRAAFRMKQSVERHIEGAQVVLAKLSVVDTFLCAMGHAPSSPVTTLSHRWAVAPAHLLALLQFAKDHPPVLMSRLFIPSLLHADDHSYTPMCRGKWHGLLIIHWWTAKSAACMHPHHRPHPHCTASRRMVAETH
jgi:hypothetical protein